MSQVKGLSNYNKPQRRLLLFNVFSTFLLAGYIFSDFSFSLIYYFFYFPVIKLIIISALGGFLLGNIIGWGLFAYIKGYRAKFVFVDIVLFISASAYVLRHIFIGDVNEPLILLLNSSFYFIPLIIFFIALLCGIKINYYLKILCNDFDDDKQGIIQFIGIFLISIIISILISGSRYFIQDTLSWENIRYVFILLPVMLISSSFLIRLPYQIEQSDPEQYEEIETPIRNSIYRDDLFFTYLNFSYIIIYVYLGFVTLIKIYGDLFYVKLITITIVLLSLLLGYLIGRIVKIAFWHIYVEMIFPIFFFIFLFISFYYKIQLPLVYGAALFAPVAFIFGFSLYHTVINIVTNFDHAKRFRVIVFSTFILPVPLLISISLIKFTYVIYFVLLYILALLNVIVPGIYLFNKQIKAYKKGLYFYFFSLVFLYHC